MGRELRGLLVRDLRVYKDEKGSYQGEVFLNDTKSAGRSRTVSLTDGLCRELLVLCNRKEPDDPVFSITYQQLDFIWKAAKKKAGLKHIRFKDLSWTLAIYKQNWESRLAA